jgi:hypothetical protein
MRTLMVAEPGKLYERDFYAWTLAQVAELRRLPAAQRNNGLDVTNLIDEVADLARLQKAEVRSRVTTLIEHLLKLDYSPAPEPRAGWIATISRTRGELEDRLSESLRRDLDRHLAKLYRRARRQVGLSLIEYGEAAAVCGFPARCPYTVDDLLKDSWYSTAQAPDLND